MREFNVIFACGVETVEYVVLDAPLPAQLVLVLRADIFVLGGPLLEIILADEASGKRQFLCHVDKRARERLDVERAAHFDDDAAALDRRHVVIDLALATAELLALAVYGDRLPWRIDAPHGEHARHVQLAIDCAAHHFEMAVFELATAERHDGVLLMNQLVVHQLRTAHVQHTPFHSGREKTFRCAAKKENIKQSLMLLV